MGGCGVAAEGGWPVVADCGAAGGVGAAQRAVAGESDDVLSPTTDIAAAYAPSASFGRDPTVGWLADSRGAAFASGRAWVYDAERARVLGLAVDLSAVELEFGAEGGGPGELRVLPGFVGDWVAADDTVVLVYDGTSVHRFGPDGSFLRRTEGGTLGVSPFATRRLRLVEGHLMFDRDRADLSTGDRAYEVWTVEAGEPVLLFERGLTRLPRVGGRYVTGGRVHQAVPSWDARGACVYATDGHGWLWRLDRRSGTVDSLRLPPPGGEEAEADPQVQAEAERLSARGGRAGPTSEGRWRGLAAAPSGAVILVRHHPLGVRPDVHEAIIVAPDGGITPAELPAVPAAFAEDGSYYAEVVDPATDVPLIQRFTPRRAPR